ncbi:hypothetical protein [Klebsiella michiganensis]|uniref:hypothetical protein n=1 Tax=Klebsiella michiganensis TaxID=1134687 RepID=UPI0004A8499B|nr:hypothetical protein [Klebsiella michiganensis]AID90815.1 hypothetical protein KONIH1_17530 [Klebsiella oxytoca KONIH1]AUV91767.1 hypothetical protein C2U44_12260 [Klebsiella oxytoca]KLU42828.1 hypothetical protein ABE97_26065 [Klebsiella michiganensis]KLU46667.1 hypothetical protein ABE84_17325 [Klebsiella michiganensis]MDK6955722.1 hypothetical protein [Klebsiella michiganensis]
MKKLVLSLFLVSASVTAQASNEAVLQKSLKPWNPLSIESSAGVVTLVMNEDSVTTQIFNSIIRMGVCSPLWLNPQKNTYLKNTKEVRVLNRYSHSGFVFENPRSSCNEAGQAKGDGSELIIASHTHAF